MITAIADTHAVIWYLFGDSRLSVPGKRVSLHCTYLDFYLITSSPWVAPAGNRISNVPGYRLWYSRDWSFHVTV